MQSLRPNSRPKIRGKSAQSRLIQGDVEEVWIVFVASSKQGSPVSSGEV